MQTATSFLPMVEMKEKGRWEGDYGKTDAGKGGCRGW